MSISEGRHGTWRQVALLIDGKQFPTGRGVLLTSGSDGYAVTVNGKVYQKGTSKTDMSASPPQSDVLVSDGPQAGQTIRQIFRVEGDVLISCQSPPGADRPTEFASRPGSGHVLSVWVRISPTAALRPPVPVRLVVALVLLAAVVGGLGEDLSERVGRWAGLAAGGVAGALFFTSIGLLLRWTWQASFVLGLVIVTADITFKETKTALASALDPMWTVVVSGSTALVLAFVVSFVASRLLKVDPQAYSISR